jgi:hypothetical protein
MKLGTKLLAIVVLSLLPTASFGQSYSQPAYPSAAGPEVAYCQTLSNMYARYIGHDWQYGDYMWRPANNDAQVAMTQCQTDSAFAIPILERELRANRFTLPPRG